MSIPVGDVSVKLLSFFTDMRARKPLTNTKISNLLLEEHNLSVSYKSVGRILEDIERDKREKINLKRRVSYVG